MSKAERFVKNIRYLASKRFATISSVETAIGVSEGYLSRCEKRACMPLDKAIMLADAVGEDFTDLLEKDYGREDRIAELEEELRRLKEGEE